MIKGKIVWIFSIQKKFFQIQKKKLWPETERTEQGSSHTPGKPCIAFSILQLAGGPTGSLEQLFIKCKKLWVHLVAFSRDEMLKKIHKYLTLIWEHKQGAHRINLQHGHMCQHLETTVVEILTFVYGLSNGNYVVKNHLARSFSGAKVTKTQNQ